jgi:hypothetical protein
MIHAFSFSLLSTQSTLEEETSATLRLVTAGQVQAGINYGTFWFALALVNAALAQLQGRSGLEWFLASLLFGPFATLLLVLQYKKKP